MQIGTEKRSTYIWTLSCSRLNKGNMRTCSDAQGLSPERVALILGAEAGAMLREREEGAVDKVREGAPREGRWARLPRRCISRETSFESYVRVDEAWVRG